MCWVRVVNNTIESTSIMSDSGEYRYRLTRIWDTTKEKAAIIMLNPSKADSLKIDDTIMNITNYLIDNNYGGIDIVNLYSFMATDPANLKYKDQSFEQYNNDFIIQVAADATMMIVAWGSDSKKYIIRKREVEQILFPYLDKLKCFCDSLGRKPRHPLLLSDTWDLIDYEFMYS